MEMYRPYVYANNRNNPRTNCCNKHNERPWRLKNFNGGCSGLKSNNTNSTGFKVSGLPRKWCEFVFRRNAENSVYKSESFRFIQKTNSLEPLVPPKFRRNINHNIHGIHRQPQRARVPVSDDYVEPLDQLVVPLTHHADLSAPSSSHDQEWRSLTDAEEPPYHEITEKYNAPYYYSDTLKGLPEAPTGPSKVPYSSPSLVDSSSHRHPHSHNVNNILPCNCSQSRQREGPQPMARKRYETAFLPANSAPTAVSPDVDSLLSAIESTRVTDKPYSRPLISGVTIVTAQTHVQYCRQGESEEDWPTHTPSPPQKHMPLSEPLPQKKRYDFVQGGCDSILSTQSSSGWSSNTSSSLSQNDNYQGNPRKHSTRVTLLMKDNSISSLESIDSTKSEDMRFSRAKERLQQNQKTTKLLSPISDKSPLDPSSSSIYTLDEKDGWLGHCYSYGGSSEPHVKANSSLHGAAVVDQLAVPWEMPKLRRRLALLADSGISLDFSAADSQKREPQFDSFSSFTQNQSIKGNLELQIPRMDSGEEVEVEEYLPFDREETEHYQENSSLNKLKRPSIGTVSSSTRVQIDRSRFDRCSMRLDFVRVDHPEYEIDPKIELEAQEWFHGHITRSEAESILRTTKEASFLVRNCESSAFNRYSLSLKSARGFIHIRIEPNSLGTFSLAEQQFPSVPHLVLHFMSNRLPIKGAEHVKLKYPVIIQLL